ncbi:radical SAM protein [Zoogloea sp.]|uniref:radical SAM protein n=1 Tax=Zoogloea sp. TaxID=49181 RepID=UPI0035B3D2CC
MPLKLRFLLTNACSARCTYCHNEGQQKARDRLDLAAIGHVLDTLAEGGVNVSEIVLSGGEPTLHPQLADIARRCKASGAQVSINTHAGHPTKLAPALPWLDELKIHVDSFDPQRQRASMGIGIAKVRQSIALAQRHGQAQRFINHPLQSLDEACAVITEARALAVDVKLIELLDTAGGKPLLHQLPWAELGYQPAGQGHWQHRHGTHRVLTRRCGQGGSEGGELFIGPDGVRRDLQAPILGMPEAFSLDMLPAACGAGQTRKDTGSIHANARNMIRLTRDAWSAMVLHDRRQACPTPLPVQRSA